MPCVPCASSCFSFLLFGKSKKQKDADLKALQRRLSVLRKEDDGVVVLKGGESFDAYFHKTAAVGEGAFGKVWRGSFTQSGLQALPGLEASGNYIAKQICKPKSDREIEEIASSQLRLPAARHIEFLHAINSPESAENYIIRRFGEFVEDGKSSSLYIIMESLEGPDMLDWLSSCDHTVPEPQAADLARQMLTALQYLHRKAGVLHRDIKFENFGFTRPATCNGPLPPLRLFDFGLAWVLPEPVTAETALTLHELGICGTPPWVAPETWQGKCGPPSDIWGIGIALHLLLTFNWPFGLDKFSEGSDAECKAIAQAVRTKSLDLGTSAWRHISPSARELVANLLAKRPAMRVTTEQALDDAWLEFPGDNTPSPTPHRLMSGASVKAERKRSAYWGALATARLIAAEVEGRREDDGS